MKPQEVDPIIIFVLVTIAVIILVVSPFAISHNERLLELRDEVKNASCGELTDIILEKNYRKIKALAEKHYKYKCATQ